MALRSIYKSATDEELAALYCLNLLWPSDIEDIALRWMLEGKGCESVAYLASKAHESFTDIQTELEKSFDEIKVETPHWNLALKRIIKFHLEKILAYPSEYMKHLTELETLDQYYGNEIVFFENTISGKTSKIVRPIPSEFDAKPQGVKLLCLMNDSDYNYGIEWLPGLTYSPENEQNWYSKLESKKKSAIRNEAKNVLDQFYMNTEMSITPKV